MVMLLHIANGLVLPAAGRAPVPLDVVVAEGRIAGLPAHGERVAGAEAIDAAGRLVMPGLVNAHTHGQFTLSRGIADRWNLEHLLNAFPWAAGGRTRAAFHEIATLLSAADAIRTGCTTLYDLFSEFPAPTVDGVSAVARAYERAGVRAVVAPMMAERTIYGAIPGLLDALPADLRGEAEAIRFAPWEEAIDRCRRLLADWPTSHERVRPALAPTIPHHCSDAFMVACRDLAREFDVGIQMHVAESPVQAVAAPRVHGASAVVHLDRLGLLGPSFTAAHAVWLDDDDMARLADRGASVAHNPGSNLRLGSGVAPVRRFLDAGVNVAIGTDSAISGDSLSMFESTRLAALVSRLPEADTSRWLSAVEALHAATEGGARALGLSGEIGAIEIGRRADLVLLDLDHGPLVPLRDAPAQLVYAENGSAVRTVIVNGEVIYRDRSFVGFDYPAVVETARRLAEEIDDATADRKRLALGLAPYVQSFCAGLAAEPLRVRRTLCH